MWANAERDGRPAAYRWRPLFNAAVWLTPTTRVPCSTGRSKKRRDDGTDDGTLSRPRICKPLYGPSQGDETGD